MKAQKISDKVYWVGAIDWQLRDFHGYATGRGTSYNAYLVLDDKITLIDTVKAQFKDELLTRISSVIDPQKIDYIISNHAEMDHSGCLPDIIKEINPEKIFASKKGVEALNDHFHFADEITAVSDGETVSLGSNKFTFFETKMLHWPDSMISYLHGDDILFSQDGFGMHLASDERFDDQLDWQVMEYE
ncbi:MBL fold metallo-hydrolase, partial [bacterium]|nr:MBL fold metallo-hydrolase [bacterium]